MKAFINGWSRFLPNEPVDNEEIEEVLGYVDGKKSRAKRIVLRNNGIKTRHYALDPKTREPTHSNAQLCAVAVNKLIEDFNIDPKSIDLLSTGTSVPDQVAPGHANMVHAELPELECEVASLSGICSASASALKYAFASIKSGTLKSAIVTGSEIASHVLRAENYQAFESRDDKELEEKPQYAFEKDFLRWMLSDGVGALWLSNEKNENGISLEVEWMESRSYANELDLCMSLGYDKTRPKTKPGFAQMTRQELARSGAFNLVQDVKLLDRHIIEYTAKKPLAEFRKKHGLLPGDVDYFIPHYSSEFFRERLFEALKEIDFELSYDKWFTTLPERGNIGTASFFIYLTDFLERTEVKDGQRILGFIPESGRFSSCFLSLKVHKN